MKLTTRPILTKLLRLSSFFVVALLAYTIVWTNAWFDGYGHGYADGIFDLITDLPKAIRRLTEFQKEW